MKNNKFIKATSIVMSAVVAGMAMGSGACYAEQTTKQTKLDKAPTKLDTAKKKLDEAKKRVKSTTSRVVKDGRKFVNKVPNRDRSLLTAGFFTATAIALGAAYYGYPNGLADLVKHIVNVEFEEGKQAKLLALRLKGYKFEDSKTADALLLISTEPGKVPGKYVSTLIEPAFVDEEEKASWVSRVMGWISQKVKPSYNGDDLKVNEVYRVTPGIESAFEQWMTESISQFGPEKASGKLEFVPIDASCLFGEGRRAQGEIDQEFANRLISDIERSAKPNGNGPRFDDDAHPENAHPENESNEGGFGGAGSGESEEVEQKVELVAYAAKKIDAGTGANADVDVKFSKGEGARVFRLKLANEVGGDIGVEDDVNVKASVKKFVDNGGGTCNFMLDGEKFADVRFVKEEKK